MVAAILDQNDQVTSGAPDTLFTSALGRVFQFELDLGGMGAAHTLQVTIEIQVVNGGAFIELYGGADMLFSGVQAAPDIIQISRPIPSVHGVRIIIDRTAGAALTVPWKVMSLGNATAIATGTEPLVAAAGPQSLFEVLTNLIVVMLTDHTNMIAGDTVTLRLEEEVRTGGADRVAFEQALVGAQSDPDNAQISVPIAMPDRGECTAELTAGGTNHDMDFTVMSVAA